MKYMPFIKVLNVFPGDDVDPGVPFPVKRPELLKLMHLMLAQLREITADWFKIQRAKFKVEDSKFKINNF